MTMQDDDFELPYPHNSVPDEPHKCYKGAGIDPDAPVTQASCVDWGLIINLAMNGNSKAISVVDWLKIGDDSLQWSFTDR